jgi:ribosome-associated translation inhibitor RaiA
MHNPVEITLRGITSSAALERYISEEARKLDSICGLILSCQVSAEALHRPKQQRAQFAAQLNITLPGTEVVVNREHGEDVYFALQSAFEAAGLQLKDHMRRQSDIEPRSPNGAPYSRR